MRTLALLAALLLLAFQARAQTKHRMGQEDQDQYQAEVKGQDQPGTGDQDVVIVITGEGHNRKAVEGFHRRRTCVCRQGHFCKVHESLSGGCKVYGSKSRLCCH